MKAIVVRDGCIPKDHCGTREIYRTVSPSEIANAEPAALPCISAMRGDEELVMPQREEEPKSAWDRPERERLCSTKYGRGM